MLIVRSTLSLFITSLLVIVTTLGICHQQPNESLIQDLHQCGDRICLLNIAHGTTRLADAITVLEADPSFKTGEYSPSKARKLTAPYYLITLFGLDTVTQVSLDFPEAGQLTAGMIVAKFGSPCSIQPRGPTMIYPYMVVGTVSTTPFNFQSRRFTYDQKVGGIALYDSGLTDCTQLAYAANDQILWQGFRMY